MSEPTRESEAIEAALKASSASSAAALKASQDSAVTLAAARNKTWVMLLLQGAAWLVAALLAYGTVNTRIQVLEVKYDRIQQDLSEMKADIKTLLAREK